MYVEKNSDTDAIQLSTLHSFDESIVCASENLKTIEELKDYFENWCSLFIDTIEENRYEWDYLYSEFYVKMSEETLCILRDYLFENTDGVENPSRFTKVKNDLSNGIEFSINTITIV